MNWEKQNFEKKSAEISKVNKTDWMSNVKFIISKKKSIRELVMDKIQPTAANKNNKRHNLLSLEYKKRKRTF